MSDEKQKTIAIGADHGGYPLKEKIKSFLNEQGYQMLDCGTNSTESVDYPKFAYAVAKQVSQKKVDFGIIINGAGIGSSMVANKVKGVRAALCYDVSTAKNSREHNNANVLTLGAGLIGEALAKQIVMTFIESQCTVDRHLKRVDMINELDKVEVNEEIFNTNFPISKEEILTDISNEDLIKIAERVNQIINERNTSACAIDPSHKDSDMVCLCGVSVERKPETIRQFLDFGVQRLGYHEGTACDCVPEDIAHCIDHTVLSPNATEADIKRICAEAREYQFATVCISPSYVSLAAKELAGSPVKVCTVVGFPSGAHLPEIKAMEARKAIRDGAREIDMVINIGALKSGNDDLVYRDIRMVCEACEDGGATSKVIIEAALLTDDEKIRACELAKKARANFVKTSTGFGPHGATAEDVDLMRRVVGYSGIGVKAAGGIRSYEDAEKMIKAGANRIGASASIKILTGAKSLTISN
ncbi:deoxyribose-phosphate aldolase [bacterium]|nr:deoxyribose-phosphate aldolase [bacterium]